MYNILTNNFKGYISEPFLKFFNNDKSILSIFKNYEAFPFLLGAVSWLVMTLLHHWHLVEILGPVYWWGSAVFSTLIILLTGIPMYKDFSKDILVLGFSMSIAFLGFCINMLSFPLMGAVIFSWGFFNLFRTMFGHMDEKIKDFKLTLVKTFGVQCLFFTFISMFQITTLVVPLWGLVSCGYLYFDKPEDTTEGHAGMVATSFVSAYFAWLLSTTLAIFPALSISYGIHIFYHDAVLTITAIGFGLFLKKNAQKGASPLFPALLVRGIESSVNQKDLKLGDIVSLNEKIGFLPGLKFKIIEVGEEAQVINKNNEEGPVDLKKGDFIGYTGMDDNNKCQGHGLHRGTAKARVVNLPDEYYRTSHDPAQSILAYFVPGVILLSLMAFSFWNYLGEHSQAMSVLINTLILACPCIFTSPLIMLEQKAINNFNGKHIKLMNLDSVSSVKADFVVLDRSHTLVKGCEKGDQAWQMTGPAKDSLKQLLSTSKSNSNFLVLSGHDDPEATRQMKKDLEAAFGENSTVTSRIWMDKRFNYEENTDSAKNKAMVINYLKKNKPCFNCDTAFNNFKKEALSHNKSKSWFKLALFWIKNPLSLFKHILSWIKNPLSWFYKPEATVWFGGDGVNDIQALKKADLGIHVGNNNSVLALSGASISVDQFSDLNTKNLEAYLKVVKTYHRYAKGFKVIALAFNVIALSLSIGGWYALFGVNMPCGLGCVVMEFSSFILAMIAKDYAFNEIEIMNVEDKNISSSDIFTRLLPAGVLSMFQKAYKRIFEDDNDNHQGNNSCCGHSHH
jgi:hypothetical protein